MRTCLKSLYDCLSRTYAANWEKRNEIIIYCVDIVGQGIQEKQDILNSESPESETHKSVKSASYTEEVKVSLFRVHFRRTGRKVRVYAPYSFNFLSSGIRSATSLQLKQLSDNVLSMVCIHAATPRHLCTLLTILQLSSLAADSSIRRQTIPLHGSGGHPQADH